MTQGRPVEVRMNLASPLQSVEKIEIPSSAGDDMPKPAAHSNKAPNDIAISRLRLPNLILNSQLIKVLFVWARTN
jgi:hypothetical protein